MLHNIDTLGADVDPAVLGLHIDLRLDVDHAGDCPAVWMIAEEGWLVVDGRMRLVEGTGNAADELEFSTDPSTTLARCGSISINCLSLFGLDRDSSRRRRSGVAEGRAERGIPNAHLHYAQGREETLGQGAGRRDPRAVRKTVGRHDSFGRRQKSNSSQFYGHAGSN